MYLFKIVKITLFCVFCLIASFFWTKSFAQEVSPEMLQRQFNDSLEALTLSKECWNNKGSNIYLSIKSGEKALNIARNNDFKIIEANTLIYLGVTYRNVGDLVKSFNYTAQALEISQSIHFPEGIAWAHIGIAALLFDENKLVEAVPHYEKALLIGKEGENSRLLSYAYFGLSRILIKQKKYEEALTLLQNTYKLNIKSKDDANIVGSMAQIGEVYFLKKDKERAITYYHKALFFAKTKKLPNENLFPLFHKIAIFYLDKKKIDSLLYYQVFAEKCANSAKVERFREESLKLKSEVYAILGQYEQAHLYLNQFINLHDSLHNQESANRLLALEEITGIKLKDRENALLQREKTIANQELKKQQWIIVIFAAGVFTAGAFAFFFFRLHRRQLRANNILEFQKSKINDINKALAKQKEELIQSNQIKDKLFSVISHDLRSPINSLTGTLTLMQMDALSPEEWQMLSNRIVFDLKQSAFLLENLLNWAKTQMNGFQVNPTNFTLNEVIFENINLLKESAKEKDIALTFVFDMNHEVYADIDSVRLVLRNLIANAVKFTNENGKVEISTTKENDWVNISVTDTGIGFGENITNAIFSKSLIVSQPGTKKEKGTGLGLLLAKEFIEKNGGKLTFNSKIGEGSAFKFSLKAAIPSMEISQNDM